MKKKSSSSHIYNDSDFRVTLLYGITVLLFAIVASRIYTLATGAESSALVLSGQYSRKEEFALRDGYVLTRELIPLGTDPSPVYIATINPEGFSGNPDAPEAIAKYAKDLTSAQIRRLIDKKRPFAIKVKVPIQSPYIKTFRYYDGTSRNGIHLVGYKSGGKGVSGLKKEFDGILNSANANLSGNTSGRLYASFEADASGRILPDKKVRIVDDGFSQTEGVITTICARLQASVDKLADELLGSGAILVMGRDGDVLAMTSRPDFVPTSEEILQLADSDRGEFVNRCTASFAPGSLFKSVTAAAALRKDLSYFEKLYTCTGSITFGNTTHRCHNPFGHGELDMTEAFANSCNCYFIMLGSEIGIENVLDMAKRLGVGESRPLYGVGNFGSNLPPTEAHYPPSAVANCVIGQGEITLSPIEAARLVYALSTGKLVFPYVVDGFLNDGKITRRTTSDESWENVLDESAVEKMRLLFKACVSEGTGRTAAPSGHCTTAGGKTATAQTGRYVGNTELNHLWFAGVYPIDNPEISVVVLKDYCMAQSENTEWIFRAICEEYELISEGGGE